MKPRSQHARGPGKRATITRAELEAVIGAVLDDAVMSDRRKDPGWSDTIMRAVDAYPGDALPGRSGPVHLLLPDLNLACGEDLGRCSPVTAEVTCDKCQTADCDATGLLDSGR